MATAKSGTSRTAKTTAKTAKSVKKTTAGRAPTQGSPLKKPAAKKVAEAKAEDSKSSAGTGKTASGGKSAENAKKTSPGKAESKSTGAANSPKPAAGTSSKTAGTTSSRGKTRSENSHRVKSARDTGSGQSTQAGVNVATAAQSGKSGGKPGKISPEQALANTRALLQAKKAHARQPQAWQKLDEHAGPVDHAGYQSPEAADKAEQLHEGESRTQAIEGSISSTGRKNQGKRDAR